MFLDHQTAIGMVSSDIILLIIVRINETVFWKNEMLIKYYKITMHVHKTTIPKI